MRLDTKFNIGDEIWALELWRDKNANTCEWRAVSDVIDQIRICEDGVEYWGKGESSARLIGGEDNCFFYKTVAENTARRRNTEIKP